MLPLGGTRGIQSQYQSCEQLPEKDAPGECAVASVWLSELLLHTGLQFVARHLPQQKGEMPIHFVPQFENVTHLLQHHSEHNKKCCALS